MWRSSCEQRQSQGFRLSDLKFWRQIMVGILGKKLGMTQIYTEDGRAYPVTVIEAGPCVVVQRKSKDKDGYSAVQLGLVEARQAKSGTRPPQGPLGKTGL